MTRLSDEQIAELEHMDRAATPAPWKWWTSCSFRRLSHDHDGDVLRGTIQRSDGHPDVLCAEEDRALIEAMRNAFPSLLAEVKEHRARAAREPERCPHPGRRQPCPSDCEYLKGAP